MRVLLRILASLLGLALAAAGALLALEVAWVWIWPDKPSVLIPWRQWRSTLDTLTWTDTTVQVTGALTALAGLILLLIAARARRKSVRLRDPAGDVTVTTTPRSLARLVGHRVRSTDGVTAATVTASARSVRVRAHGRLASESELHPRVTQVTTDVLDSLPLPRTPKISVSIDSPRDRR